MILKNYYKILELETSHVSIDEIKVAYRAAAKKYHPDVNVGDRLAEEKIKDINEAYRVLSTPSSKRKYDRIWNAQFNRGKRAFSGKGEKGAILNMFLGNVEKGSEQTQNMKKHVPIKGENIETEINATIEEAFYGQGKKISLKDINNKKKIFNITIPKGIRNGEKIRLIGQGKSGYFGGKNGDLLIKINIDDDSKFKLEGNDIYTNILVSPWEAALGSTTHIELFNEEAKVYIPKGTQSGEKIKIPGKGYINSDNSRGDLIAEVKIMIPKQLTDEERTIFEKLNKISKFNPRG